MTQVYKFGGSTIRSAEALRSIANIINSSQDLSVVVLSATHNTTNELEEIAAAAVRSIDDAQELIENLLDKHYKLTDDLEITEIVKSDLESLKEELLNSVNDVQRMGGLNAQLMDAIYSIGERASSAILFHFLDQKFHGKQYQFLDARDIVVTNNKFSSASPLFYEINERRSLIEKDKVYITQGFIGKDLAGNTTTLGREGSDYTAAILSWAISAEKLVVWKDVDGIFQCDPKVYSEVKILEKLSYEQAELLTEKGAKVLFPRTMAPLRERSIELIVKSTFNPTGAGTKISLEESDGAIGITTRLDEGAMIISLLSKEIFKNFNHQSFLKLLEQHEVQAQVFEHSQSVFAVSIQPEDKNRVVSLFAKNSL